jgi:8-oxo-dGTP pyrophosphatase MutT (NUDIX family)
MSATTAEQLFQIGIKGLIRNKAGKILMVHVPSWGDNPAYWDLPGGRMDPGETFLETLKRELQEEIGVTYIGTPQQLISVLTSITIPVGDARFPLVLTVYEVELPDGASITLDPDSPEEEFGWFAPTETANKLGVKFPSDFCELVAKL